MFNSGDLRTEVKMAEDKKSEKGCRSWGGSGAGGAVYGLGFLGALVYFLQHAVGIGAILLGILKSIVWPALLVYKVLGMLNF